MPGGSGVLPADDVEIGLAVSPREWCQRLHRYLADHGGARVRTSAITAADALGEPFDVFVVDDTTSYLSRHLVTELHRLGRCVLGVHDPDDPRSKGELLDLGVDDVVERSAPAEVFVAAIQALRPRTRRRSTGGHGSAGTTSTAPASPRPRGQVTVVCSPSGGCGATEVAVGLAAAAARWGESVVLVDGDDSSPAVAQRLDLAAYPNLRMAVDAVHHRGAPAAAALQAVPDGAFGVLAGLARPDDWSELRAVEVLEVVRRLALGHHHVVVNAGSLLEDLPVAGGPGRYAVSRALIGAADALVVVAAPTPVGVARLVDRAVALRELNASAPLHVVCNRAPSAAFRRGELTTEITRTVPAASLWYLPDDQAVERAAWAGTLVRSTAFTRELEQAARAVLSRHGRPAARAARRQRRALSLGATR